MLEIYSSVFFSGKGLIWQTKLRFRPTNRLKSTIKSRSSRNKIRKTASFSRYISFALHPNHFGMLPEPRTQNPAPKFIFVSSFIVTLPFMCRFTSGVSLDTSCPFTKISSTSLWPTEEILTLNGRMDRWRFCLPLLLAKTRCVLLVSTSRVTTPQERAN